MYEKVALWAYGVWPPGQWVIRISCDQRRRVQRATPHLKFPIIITLLMLIVFTNELKLQTS